jgi:hypothetical protein
MAVARALVSSASDRWFTPPDLLAETSDFFGGSYFDPCPAVLPGEAVQVDGLALPWRGRVFVNPPYGPVVGRWVAKADTEQVDELLLLVPARTDTRWFVPLWDWPALCFLRGRLHFSGSSAGAPFPSVLAYRSRGPQERVSAFIAAFGHRGAVVRRIGFDGLDGLDGLEAPGR